MRPVVSSGSLYLFLRGVSPPQGPSVQCPHPLGCSHSLTLCCSPKGTLHLSLVMVPEFMLMLCFTPYSTALTHAHPTLLLLLTNTPHVGAYLVWCF